MKFTRILVLILMMSGIMSASADKMSPDTRIRLEQRVNKAPAKSAQDTPIKVFIAIEAGFDPDGLLIPGVEINSVFGKVVTATVMPEAMEALCDLDGVRYIQMASDVKLLNDFGRRELHVDGVHHNTGGRLPQGYTGKGVIVGMVDTGVEYGHHAFYSTDGSELRIRRVWNQESFGTPPAGYNYGAEHSTEEEILKAATDSRSQYHGSHTMGTAAGGGNLYTRYYGMAPDADIVFVSFKNDDNTSIADAIKYIFDYADEVGMPCVINLSLGSHHGPHDGTSFLDQIIDELSGPGRIIVGAVGNEGESRMHASKTFTETDTTMKTLLTFSSTANHKLHYIDIWGTPGSNLKVGMGIFNSLKGVAVDRSKVFDTSDEGQKTVGYFTYLDEQGVDMDAVIYGEINPENNSPHVWIQAEVGDLGQGRMPGLIVDGDPGATVHMWNEGLHEFSSNNKSGFTNGDNSCTAGEIGGTAKRIITVGSYDGRDSLPVQRYYYIDMNEFSFYKQHQHSAFSSCGPTADGRTVPHVVAPGMPVISAYNRYAFDAAVLEEEMSDYTQDKSGRKYYYGYSMGTSMSAPHVTGVVALMLQANPYLTPEQARGILQETADTWPEMGALPNNAFGAGRVNSLECVHRALDISVIEDIAVDTDNATRVWAENGTVNVLTPAIGSTLRLYSVAGMLLHETVIDSTSTVIDASRWGHGILIAEISGDSSRRTFKIAL